MEKINGVMRQRVSSGGVPLTNKVKEESFELKPECQ